MINLVNGYFRAFFMNVKFLPRDEPAHPNSVVCVIDVISAFTTAAYLFSQGAEEITIAKTIDQAHKYRKNLKTPCLIGEAGGKKIEGFDYHNSVLEFANERFDKKNVVLKTTSGTRGLLNNVYSKLVLAASFVNADTTADFLSACIETNNFNELSFIITNNFKSSEDFALASYLCEKIFNNNNGTLTHYLNIVRKSEYGKTIINNSAEEDEMDYVLKANQFKFVMLLKTHCGRNALIKGSH